MAVQERSEARWREVAAIYSRRLGREIRYGGDDLDVWAEQVKYLMPEFAIPEMRIMYRFYQNHGAAATAEDLEKQQKILGRRPRSLDDFVKEIASAWKSAVPQAA